jgi:hypothetical protein
MQLRGGKMSGLTADFGSLSQREFRVGGALDKAISVFFRNILPFSLLSFVAWLPAGYLTFASLGLAPEQRAGVQGLAAIIGLLFQLVAMAAVLQATFQDLRGRQVNMGTSIMHGLKRFFPLIGGVLLIALGAGLGLVLLVIPGIMLIVRWYIFAPVCVVEKLGPLASMKRSAELTEGNRWKLFALIVIIGVIGAIASGLIVLALATTLSPMAALGAQGIWRAVWSAFTNVLTVVIYLDLRQAKEGADIESIASVFD